MSDFKETEHRRGGDGRFVTVNGLGVPASTQAKLRDQAASAAKEPSEERLTTIRDDPNEFRALCIAASERFGFDPGIVEKDYWATETLRAIYTSPSPASQVVFKGGTSLTKGFRLIERFSEDIDLIVVFDGDLSQAQRKKALRQVAQRVTDELGVEYARQAEGKGYLNARLTYPAAWGVDYLSEGVLLEMGTRGGPYPQEVRPITSLVGETATATDPSALDEFLDLQPFDATLLSPERTLAEKLAFLHHRASVGDATALDAGARHLYDVALLVQDDEVAERLADDRIAELMADIDERSEAAGWGWTARPAAGFAASPAFDLNAETAVALRSGYERTLDRLVWGTKLPFEDAIAAVRASADLI